MLTYVVLGQLKSGIEKHVPRPKSHNRRSPAQNPENRGADRNIEDQSMLQPYQQAPVICTRFLQARFQHLSYVSRRAGAQHPETTWSCSRQICWTYCMVHDHWRNACALLSILKLNWSQSNGNIFLPSIKKTPGSFVNNQNDWYHLLRFRGPLAHAFSLEKAAHHLRILCYPDSSLVRCHQC